MFSYVRHSVVALLVTASALAQDVTFVTSVQPTRAAVGSQIQLSFVLSGSQTGSPKNFRAPDLSAFVVLSGPMESSQYQWINGKASSSLSYVYVVTGRKAGTITIGPASVDVDGTIYKTKPVQVAITPGGTQAQNKGTAAPAGQGSVADQIGNNLFIRATVDKRRVRQGEQFTITYKLYTRININNYMIAKAPTYEGFWAEDFDQPKSPQVTSQLVQGKEYRVATIKRTALFATQPGRMEISPLEVRCAVQVQTRQRSNDPFDIFNDPFFSNRFRTQEADIASNALTITVDPLPTNPPKGFSGAAGSYSFTGSVDKKDVKTGDPITLTLTVSGSGNVKLVSVPKPTFPSDFETYEPKVTENISRSGTIIQGKKIAEYLMIPRNAGERVVEPVSFVYYDLGRKTYVTLKSPRFVFNVTPGREMAGGGGAMASKEDVKLLGEDIRFLKLTPGSLERSDKAGLLTGWLMVALGLPPLMFVGAFVYRRRRERLLGNISLLKSQKAGREASRRLKTARKLLAQGNTESYHAEISKALFGYLGDKLRMPMATLTLDTVLQTLTAQSVPPETRELLRTCVERAEFSRFAPGSDTTEARKDLLDMAARAINSLEKSLGR